MHLSQTCQGCLKTVLLCVLPLEGPWRAAIDHGWISFRALRFTSRHLKFTIAQASCKFDCAAKPMKLVTCGSPSLAVCRSALGIPPSGWRIGARLRRNHQTNAKQPRLAEVEVEVTRPEVLQQIPGAPEPGTPAGPAVMTVSSASKVLALSLIGFAVVSGDVFSPSSLHLLAPFDQGAHAWVVQNVPYDFQAFTARKLISDAFIVVPFLGWIYAAVVAARPGQPSLNAPPSSNGSAASWQPTLYALFLSLFTYNLGGAIKHGDPAAVALVKYSFQRPRPLSEIYTTFSFPSGHTTAAVLITGLSLFLLLPLAVYQQQQGTVRPPVPAAGSPQGNGSSLGNGSGSSNGSSPALGAPAGAAAPATTSAAMPFWYQMLMRYRIPLWVASAGVTATGRVLGDMHWVSDTVGGACFAAALVSGTVLTWHLLAGSGEQAAARE